MVAFCYLLVLCILFDEIDGVVGGKEYPWGVLMLIGWKKGGDTADAVAASAHLIVVSLI